MHILNIKEWSANNITTQQSDIAQDIVVSYSARLTASLIFWLPQT